VSRKFSQNCLLGSTRIAPGLSHPVGYGVHYGRSIRKPTGTETYRNGHNSIFSVRKFYIPTGLVRIRTYLTT